MASRPSLDPDRTASGQQAGGAPPRKPVNPHAVLLAAIVLPGGGHVLAGQPLRGLVFIFFIMLFGVLTLVTTDPDQSFIARHAGGLFVWAISIPDAYRIARLRAAPRR